MASSKRKFACAINLESLIQSDCYFDALGSLVIVLDEKGTIRLFNSGAEEMLGYKSEEVIGKNWFNTFLPKDIKPQVKELFGEMMTGKKDFIDRYENEVLSKKGEKIYLQWHSSVLRGNENKINGIVASASNITDLLKAKSELNQTILELRTREEYFDLAVEATRLGIWEWNIQTGEVNFDDRWAEIVGYTLKELEPMTIETWNNLCHPDDLKKSEELLEEYFAGKTEKYVAEVRMKHKNGNWIWVLDQGQAYERDKKGRPIHMAGTHLDISERKKQEQDIEEKVAQLERLNNLMVGRELKMIELKDEVERLKNLLGPGGKR